MNRITSILSRLSPARRQDAQTKLGDRLAGAARLPLESPGRLVSDDQLRIWSLHQAGAGAAYTVSCAYRIQGALDVRALRRALRELSSRHQTLRTGFNDAGGELVAVVHSDGSRLAVVGLTNLPADRRTQYVSGAVHEQACRAFRFDGKPPIQFILYMLDAGSFVLHLTLHHILCDQWSLEIMRRDLFALYGALAAGHDPPAARAVGSVPQPHIATAEDEIFWLRMLEDLPHYADLPFDRLPTADNNWQGERRYVSYTELGEAVARFAAQHNCTVFHVLLAALALVCSRWVGSRDMCIGTRIAGRSREETAEAIGCFVKLLPLRLTVQAELTTVQWLDAVRGTTISVLEREHTPFEALLNLLKCERDSLLTPLVPVTLTHQNIPTLEANGTGGLQIEVLPHHNGTSKSELDFAFEGQGPSLEVAVEYRSSLFDWRTIEALIDSHKAALRWMLANPAGRLMEFESGQANAVRERAVLRGASAARGGTSLAQRFADVARRQPDHRAVSDGRRTLTFAELEQLTARAATRLLDSPLARGHGPVAIFLSPDLDWLLAALACLRAGIPYIALNPEDPADFCELLRRTAQAKGVILKEEEYPHARGDVFAMRLEPLLTPLLVPHASLPGIPCDSLEPAYFLYTSGSTGTPKILPVAHRALLNCIDSLQRAYPFETDDVVGMRTSPTFAPAVKQWLGGLLAGRPVALLTPAAVQSPAMLASAIAQQSISRLYLVPSQIRDLAQQLSALQRLESVRLLTTGAEPLSRQALQDVRFAFPRARLVSNYGCSELADITYGELRRAEELSCVGKPIENTAIYLLSASLEPVPMGAVGEIFVAGESLGVGYLVRADLTAAAYLPDPFSATLGTRMFRTGDFGRINADGELVYLGRRDQQLKVNGCRVDAGHVAGVLLSAPAVQKAFVAARPNRNGQRVLVAYICPELPRPEIASLRRYLLAKLPLFMQPSAIVPLGRFPLLSNGKLDWQALPEPDWEQFSGDRAAPGTRLESTLASIWREVLNVPEVGVDDNFFALGGHSVLAIRVLAEMRASLGIEISQASFFQSPTIRELAKRIEPQWHDPPRVAGVAGAEQSAAPSRQ